MSRLGHLLRCTRCTKTDMVVYSVYTPQSEQRRPYRDDDSCNDHDMQKWEPQDHKAFPMFMLTERGALHLDNVLKSANGLKPPIVTRLPGMDDDEFRYQEWEAEDTVTNVRLKLYLDLLLLEHYGHKGGTRCDLYPDHGVWGVDEFANPGFGFVIYRTPDKLPWPLKTGYPEPSAHYLMEQRNYKFMFNGGLLFHGAHDGFGSGAGPTFAVCLTKTQGWSIHT